MPLQLPARERQGRACDRGTSGLVRGAEEAQRRGTVKPDLPPHTHARQTDTRAADGQADGRWTHLGGNKQERWDLYHR